MRNKSFDTLARACDDNAMTPSIAHIPRDHRSDPVELLLQFFGYRPETKDWPIRTKIAEFKYEVNCLTDEEFYEIMGELRAEYGIFA